MENSIFAKILLIWLNVTYPETNTLRKMSGAQNVV